MIRTLFWNIVHRPWCQVACIVVMVVAAYGVILQSDFRTMDDEVSIVQNDRIRGFDRLGTIFTTSYFGARAYYRPLVLASYLLEYQAVGLHPFYYYLDNIILHILTALLVLVLFRQLWRSSAAAFAVALLFAIHPIQWEAVSNIPGRAILLAGFFVVAALTAFVRARGEWRSGYYVLSLAALAAGLLSKESAAMLPVLLLSYQWLIARRPGDPLRRWLAPVIPFFVLAAGYVLLRRYLGMTQLHYWPTFNEALLGFLSFLRGMLTYLRLLVLPLGLVFDRSRPLFVAWWQPQLWLTLAALTAFGAVVIKFRRRFSRQALFLASWFVIDLVPVSQLFVGIGVQPGYISVAEHFLYTAVIGIFGLAVLGGRAVGGSLRARISPTVIGIVLAGFVAFLWLGTLSQNMYALREISMFEETLAGNPRNVRIRNSLALAYAQVDRFDEAETHFRKVLAVQPNNVRAKIGLGKALIDQGRVWEGLTEYNQIVDAGSSQRLLEANRAAAYALLEGRYLRQLTDEPENARLHYSLGVVHSHRGRLADAEAAYRRALALDPDFREAVFNLASTLALQGREADAAEYYRQVLLLPPSDDDLHRAAVGHLERIRQKMEKAGVEEDQL